ncbi:PH domain-containing protein [Sanguibacter antarcticus]|uniref:PH (Pleckstrin Homology) domain-containing protein n=1 Tax=Sanguibacter antarcticus TaxID=372484 RepID=A0A2A9E3I2_9MICO|nr:PH domain-containing protein [Sanguibacter antarcticus]PFG33131.1 PH (Pleckstrin Homology) domain-containing protein [Sanguibacter antarcticus]
MATPDDQLYAPFRPRFVRYVSSASIAAATIGLMILLTVAPGTGGQGYARSSAAGMSVVVLAGIAFLWRQGSVRADVDATSITVRNLVVVRTFAWEQVLAVSFGTGDPWVMLELADGNQHPVMGIQRADGAHAASDARRLATLVALHGEAADHTP